MKGLLKPAFAGSLAYTRPVKVELEATGLSSPLLFEVRNLPMATHSLQQDPRMTKRGRLTGAFSPRMQAQRHGSRRRAARKVRSIVRQPV